MGEEYVKRSAAYPLVRPGETVIYDPARREPTDGALCVLEWRSGRRSVLLTNHRAPGGRGEARWFADPVNRPPNRAAMERRQAAGTVGTLYASEGPFTEEHLRETIVGTVIGILVPDRASVPQDEAPADVADHATETLPAGEQDADPIFAAIKRHVASREALTTTANEADEPWRVERGLDTSTQVMAAAAATYDTADAAEDAAWSALFATRSATPAGLVALIRHLQIWAPENAGLGGAPDLGDIFGSIASDAERLLPGPEEDADDPLTVENAAPIPFEAYTFDDPAGSPADWVGRFSGHSVGLCIADKTLRMTKPELIAFIRGAAERGAADDEIMFKAINAAQKTLAGWAEMLSVAEARYLVAASAMTVENDAQQGGQDREA